MSRNVDAWGPFKAGLRIAKSAKKKTEDSGFDLCRFLKDLGAVWPIFVALETVLVFSGFSLVSQILSSKGGGGKSPEDVGL